MKTKILRQVKKRFEIKWDRYSYRYHVFDHEKQRCYREENHFECVSRIFSIILGDFTYLDWLKRKADTREKAKYHNRLKICNS